MECMVCMEPLQDGHVYHSLECSHAVCKPCMRKWRKEHQHADCVVCQPPVPEKTPLRTRQQLERNEELIGRLLACCTCIMLMLFIFCYEKSMQGPKPPIPLVSFKYGNASRWTDCWNHNDCSGPLDL